MKTEIYIHIPFCVRKCAYCDFLSFPAAENMQKQYLDALLQEIRDGFGRIPDIGSVCCRPEEKNEASSIFIGGGTPSVLPAEGIEEILKAVRHVFFVGKNAEITIEVNPGTVDPEKLQRYQQAGISRISIGCQSFQNAELQTLGRIHTREDILQCAAMARRAGFQNLNIDLMSGIPGQTLASWEDTLHQAVHLEPEHISAYSLILEEGTPFFERYGCGGGDDLPDEETERRMYERTGEILSAAGYRQYEISNYARKGYACRHNLGYWTGVPYMGFGLGAAGYLPAEGSRYFRYTHTRDLQTYLKNPFTYQEAQMLNKEGQEAEFMILGLRMTDGVEEEEFGRRFGEPAEAVYGQVLDKYERLGLLIREDGHIRLSRAGISVSNPILADFL